LRILLGLVAFRHAGQRERIHSDVPQQGGGTGLGCFTKYVNDLQSKQTIKLKKSKKFKQT
jgi:hypothetical protein